MLAFIVIAVLLTAGASALLLWPLLRRRDDQRTDPITAVVVMCGLFAWGGIVYALASKFEWVEAPAVADTPAASAARLAKQLARQPDNLEGWMKLGEQYFDLEQYPLAIRAFQRADRLANGTNAEAISAMAETMLAQDFENIRGAAGRLFERVLEMEPNNPKALLYSALAALGRGENPTARERFQRMLATNPPQQIRDIVEKQLQAIDAAEMAQAHGGATPAGGTAVAADSQAQVQVRITVSPSLRYEVSGASALFVAARDPNQPGPPFAAKRLPLDFPVDVTLTAADAMLPQRRISSGQTLDVVARISLSGQPQSASGDPFGQVSYHVGKDGRLNIVIDKLAP
jgi:cytochrome c-type biogenesis protein CcmH